MSNEQSWREIIQSITDLSKEMHAIMEERTKRLREFYEAIAEFQKKIIRESIKALEKLKEQYRIAIEEGINNFESPEKYNPDAVKINSWTEELAIRGAFDLLDELKGGYFFYMFERYRKGLDAHFRREYQLSIFTFLSMIDGILKEFCKRHKEDDCKYRLKYPTFEESLNHFISHYKFDAFVKREEFKERLDAFFEHRHQIMHGDRYAYFDKNISIIALLFLTLIYYVVKDALKESSKN